MFYLIFVISPRIILLKLNDVNNIICSTIFKLQLTSLDSLLAPRYFYPKYNKILGISNKGKEFFGFIEYDYHILTNRDLFVIRS